MVKTYAQLYLDARRSLMEVEDQQTASLLARNLLCYVSGKSREAVLADREKYACEAICEAMDAAVQRLLSGEPLAYVLGEWEFYGMTLYVDPNVLIPRDDTCAVTAMAIKKALFLDQEPRILDLCTGSGCIGLAIAHRVKDAKVTLADISKDALSVAKRNVTRQKLGGRVTCVQADALTPPPAFMGKFDMIVSNPPYITTKEMEELPASVADYEPHLALHGGEDGLDFYRSIIKNYTRALKSGGYLCFEYDPSQGDDICRLLETNGYTVLERTRDYNDRERAVLAQYGKKED
ncbi:MAG: peptide chain release factor N(5)-glutamine methyltransferase [Oscillospiraceae bacterium]|nr:peptide chain release factor N(5)-glutamine methyltransferase [Oscillospiraceae bacterium]